MATSKDKAQSLTFTITGSRIPADKFRAGINAFMSLIDEVVRDFSGSRHSVKWIISVSPGSAILHFRPESVSPRMPLEDLPIIIENIQSGLNTLETTSRRPPHFNDVALKKAKEIASITGDDGQGIEAIEISTNGRKNSITTKTLANVDSLFKTTSRDWGSIEGRITEVSERGERHVYIYDRLLDKSIRCLLTEDKLNEIAPHWGKWVNVSGFIRYFMGGEIKDIAVEDFQVFPDLHTLPSFEDVQGLFREVE